MVLALVNPAEWCVGGIYMAVLPLYIIMGLLLTAGVGYLLNRWNLERYIWHPPLFLLSCWIIIVCTLGLLFSPKGLL